MKSDVAEADVLIVGGGFSGTMMAARLVQRGLRVVLVEGGGRAGRGTAYSTREAVHLLNVPAARMSAWPDRPDDFVVAGHGAGEFAPRRAFGAYLGAILEEAVAHGVTLVEGTAVSAVHDGAWRVTLGDDRVIGARALVLAQGNQPPGPMRLGAGVPDGLFVNNPWSAAAHAAVERVARDQSAVMTLGTGLTMVDTVLSLDAAGHRGRIVALSRRGQMPRAHAAHDPAPVALGEVPQDGVLPLWRWLRRRSVAVGWRAAVDSLRPHAQTLWRDWSADQQRRFLRHARPYWDVHRHRIAPQVAAQLRGMIADGRLEVVAGRVQEVGCRADGLTVTYGRRHAAGSSTEPFGALFNCTGPLGAMRDTRDPLLGQMMGDGLVAVDRLGMGLAVDDAGRAGPAIWALGPLTKGQYWEIVAVPDIRQQVADVAAHIVKELEA